MGMFCYPLGKRINVLVAGVFVGDVLFSVEKEKKWVRRREIYIDVTL